MDSFTGTKMTRPEFDKLLEELKAGDTLVVAKLDRFARSVSQASDLITKLIDEGIRVDVCNLGILDNLSMSILMRNILLSFAQMIIRDIRNWQHRKTLIQLRKVKIFRTKYKDKYQIPVK